MKFLDQIFPFAGRTILGKSFLNPSPWFFICSANRNEYRLGHWELNSEQSNQIPAVTELPMSWRDRTETNAQYQALSWIKWGDWVTVSSRSPTPHLSLWVYDCTRKVNKKKGRSHFLILIFYKVLNHSSKARIKSSLRRAAALQSLTVL